MVNATGRSRTSKKRRGLIAVAAGLALAIVCVDATAGNGVLTAALFHDNAAAKVPVATYTVPAVVVGAAQIDGTGEVIATRLQASCTEPGVLTYRRRDRVVDTTWGDWTSWTTWTQEAGYTAWMTSTIYHVAVKAEVQWEARCDITTWAGGALVTVPTEIIRTT